MKQDVKTAISEIVWMARRYAEGRHTYASTLFNESYDILQKEIGFKDEVISNGTEDEMENFPHATRGKIV